MADEKDLEGDDAETEGGGGKKKLFIIIGAAVLLLVASGVAAFLLLGGDDEVVEGEEAAEEEVVRLPPIYHSFEPKFVVNLPPGGKARMLQVGMQVMAHDQAVIDYLAANGPMLRHHLFDLFSSQDANALYRRDGREALAQAVKKVLDQKLKEAQIEPEVQAVYFSELVLQ